MWFSACVWSVHLQVKIEMSVTHITSVKLDMYGVRPNARPGHMWPESPCPDRGQALPVNMPGTLGRNNDTDEHVMSFSKVSQTY